MTNDTAAELCQTLIKFEDGSLHPAVADDDDDDNDIRLFTT